MAFTSLLWCPSALRLNFRVGATPKARWLAESGDGWIRRTQARTIALRRPIDSPFPGPDAAP
jgi:hypothetical protein